MSDPHEVDVVVVGGGIAGLTAAIALKRAGIRVQIIERATALTQAGTALSLWPNALAALARIGLSSEIAAIGYQEPVGTIRDWSGREIVRLDQSRLQRQLGTPTLIVNRGDLQRVLLDAAGDIPMLLHSSVSRVSTASHEGVVELAGGEEFRAPVVLCCDGIRSVGRAATGNPAPRYRNRTSWRAVIKDGSDLVAEACLSTGQGKQFVVSPLAGSLTYWAADVGLQAGANEALVDRKRFLLDSFSGWHAPVTELIGRTDEQQLVIADFYDSVPRELVAGRVALLGDAAHPMTPDLGQGACQGIEDGVVVATCLARESNPDIALAAYQAARLRRVKRMVRESRWLGILATAESQIASATRNAVVAHMPGWLNRTVVARYASEDAFLRTLTRLDSLWARG
jgi:2-polyprenyl-6-methoxyphenol hydroxylase-like FAD-dependent oxidoreductase